MKNLTLFPFPVETDADRDVVGGKGGRILARSQRDFGRETLTARRVRPAGGILEAADQLDLNRRLSFQQSDRYVHMFAETSSNMSSDNVTSRNIAAMSSPEILEKSFSNGATKMPHKSIDAGLTVSSPL